MDSEVVVNGGEKAHVRPSRCPHWSYCLLVAIILALSIAVSLVLLPYYLREEHSTGSDPLSCSPSPYTGSVCLEELTSWQSCLPEQGNTTSEILISSSVDQELAESQAVMLFTGLGLVGTSAVCEREFRSFWCLLLFGVCDGNNLNRLPSFELCNSLQTDTCYDLIQFAASVPEFRVIIQNCNNFRLSSPPPCRNASGEMERTEYNVSCSDGFYYDEKSLFCRPKCGEWTPLTPDTHTALFVLLIAGNVSSILICTAVLILSAIKYKQIFTFPSVLIVYPTLTVLAVSILDLISFLPVNSLLCNSDDFLENLSGGNSATPLCIFQGGLLLYASLVLSLFWLFQTASYFWVVTYPIHFRSFNTSGKIKAIHVTAVIVSFTLPTLPAVVIYFDEGYGLSLFAPNKCVTLSVDMFIYSFSVPLVTIVIFGISLLVATVWKVANVKERLQGKPVPMGAKLKSAELKLILVIIAYMCVAIQTTTSANVTLSRAVGYLGELESYFLCEALGDPAMECPTAVFDDINRDSFVQTFVYITFNLYPAVFFIFLAPPKRCSRMCRRKEKSEVPTTSVPSSQA